MPGMTRVPVGAGPANDLPMRICVTGGAGFIGSHLVDRFINDGHDVVALDDACELLWRTRVWDQPLRGHAHALAVDERGAVVAFDARDGGTLLAAVDHEGAVRVRARRMERNTRDPQVFLQTDARGRRVGIQVVAVRTLETGDQLEAWRLGPDGLLGETRALTTSPDVQSRVSAADPWGGGLVGFTRAEGARGSVVAGLFARVCP